MRRGDLPGGPHLRYARAAPRLCEWYWGVAVAPGAPLPADIEHFTGSRDVFVSQSSVGEVHFPHRAHVKQKCVTCHHQIHAEALDTPHDDYLDSSWIHTCGLHMLDRP